MKTQDEYEDEFGKPEPVPAAQDIAADDDFEFAPKEEAKPVAAPEPVAPAKPQSFKEAFKAARAENLKNGTNKPFTWHGKPGVKFSTALDGEGKKAAKPAVKASQPVAATTSTEKPRTFSVVKKDNRPKVEIKAPSGSMAMPAAEKPMVDTNVGSVDLPAMPTGGRRYFNDDGSVKGSEPAPPAKKSTSPVRTSSPMRHG